MRTNTMKDEIIKKIKDAVKIPILSNGRNSMGVSENFYNPYYLIGKCFTEEELNSMNEICFKNIIKLAEFSSEVFY